VEGGVVGGGCPTGPSGSQPHPDQVVVALLQKAYPALVAGYGAAERQARAMALGKLWVALSRERIGGLVPLTCDGRAVLRLPDGTRISATPAIADAFAQRREGLAVTMHAARPQVIDHPVGLLGAILAGRPRGADTRGWRQLSAELGESVANHALALVAESWRRERLRAAAHDSGNLEASTLRWAAGRAATDPGFSPLALFEQSVVDGHPLHPCARVRGGMTLEELCAYAPEWAGEVAIRIVAIARSSFAHPPSARHRMRALLSSEHPGAVEAADAHLRGVRRDPADYELLPVHPWQLPRLAQVCSTAGAVIAIPGAWIPARPLLSLRTLAPRTDRRAAHLKTAVDIRLTTAIRVVSPATLYNGPLISTLLAEISRRERGFGGRFVSLTELAGGSYQPGPGGLVEATARLAAIARESPECHAGGGEVALPVAALAARSPLSGRPLLAEVLDQLASELRASRAEAAARFLAGYCECALPALFALLSRWGVALEAHGQNAVVVLREGWPVRLLYRDFGGIRVSPARLSRAGLAPPAVRGALPTDDEDELRAGLFFPLIGTNLGQVLSTLAREGEADVGSLWELVAQRCHSVYATLTADPAIATQAGRDEQALFAPALRSKSMLRVHMSADPHTPQWVGVPNPLTAAAG
jgi:siderophore synthetase component